METKNQNKTKKRLAIWTSKASKFFRSRSGAERPSADVERRIEPSIYDSIPVTQGQKGKGSAVQRTGNLGNERPSAAVSVPLNPSLNVSVPRTEGQRDADVSALQQAGNSGSEISVIQPLPEASNSVKTSSDEPAGAGGTSNIGESKLAEACPYCNSKNFIKRGIRKNKHQVVQLYECKNEECGRTFTAQDVKGRKFPLNIVIEGMSLYNLGFTLEQACSLLEQKFKVNPQPETLSGWVEQYKQLCRYERLRPFAVKLCQPKDTVEVVNMAHRQLFRFRYHRPKAHLMLQEFTNRNLAPLKEYLDNVSAETPHQYFQEGERMSEIRSKLDTSDMIVKGKFNYANRLAAFALQAVKSNKDRHEQLQRFMIANDSCTVATEVPVYIRKEDIAYMENVLKFKISDNGKIELKGKKTPIDIPKLLTGHIDFVQIRNGQAHLLDYKPNAAAEKPIEQLTWYALAMSRLTGLRLFEFKCAWFDEKEYFEFYPLHVVKKLKPKVRKGRRIFFKDGTWTETSKKKDVLKVV